MARRDARCRQDEPLVVKSRLLVQLELALPWRPLLGWVWGVDHSCAGAGWISSNKDNTLKADS